ncbi:MULTISPECIES: transcription antitermination factor NusB [Kocuria]|uniref:Transcription antitermination protein NusB n=1 Tax=Kocuria marina subsp. indica TaxID=1049583 RepID=A0A1X7C513_9MICC|nr:MULTISPECIES: transcription antitermination factor NusB [Kocuria]MBN6811110.1 transcription antitermination factor NusB [Kocuria indica]MBN6842993.1 transcription antitermination factor NusB [Kocuria indica]MCG7431650.1 transcription antitermination factor NusB [Kocuria indica]MCT1722600.1 transcription antitermination factor NusB [Kocuria marina]MCT1734903.1 transcription antitermination factor NusB [Kocuria marina]
MSGARSKARIRAVEILFEAEQRNESVRDALVRRRENSSSPINPYTVDILEGVHDRREDIDEFLETYSQGWELDRMPAVDRNVLRVGAWELLYNSEIPDGVAVAEAVAVARQLSTDDSPRFVNGLLGRLQKVKPSLLDD